MTTLGDCRAGTRVNLEVDIIARYLERSGSETAGPVSVSISAMKLNSIDEILADMRAGRMVVIMDDEDRENEGDLIMAAEFVRAEDVNFMARYARGLICLTLTRDRCRQLRLPLMVSDTNVDHRTNFTVSIEAAEGVTTGISAHDRAQTIRAAVRRDARPEDLRQPGHIFPLMAQPGGVLTRAGHTEAGCDLARLAGLEPAAVIVEILNDDGTMARRPGSGDVRAAAPAQDRHDRRPDPLSAREGALGRAHRRAGGRRPSSARSACSATRTTSIAPCTWRWSLASCDGKRVPLVRVHLKDTLRRRRRHSRSGARLAAALGDAADRARRVTA